MSSPAKRRYQRLARKRSRIQKIKKAAINATRTWYRETWIVKDVPNNLCDITPNRLIESGIK